MVRSREGRHFCSIWACIIFTYLSLVYTLSIQALDVRKRCRPYRGSHARTRTPLSFTKTALCLSALESSKSKHSRSDTIIIGKSDPSPRDDCGSFGWLTGSSWNSRLCDDLAPFSSKVLRRMIRDRHSRHKLSPGRPFTARLICSHCVYQPVSASASDIIKMLIPPDLTSLASVICALGLLLCQRGAPSVRYVTHRREFL